MAITDRLAANAFFLPRLKPLAAPFAFRATTPAQAGTWRRRTRAALATALGWQDAADDERIPSRRLERVDRGDHIREKHVLRTSAAADMTLYLLLPKGVRRPPVVLAYHGHGYGAKEVVGLREDGSEREIGEGYQRDFALSLCRLGCAVAVPEIACFGQRQNDYRRLPPGSPAPYSCHHTAALALHLGGSVLGLRVLEARRVVTWLGRRRDLDGDRLGAMGISGGGMLTMYHAALDTRVRAAVISGYLCDWRSSTLAMHHCTCNYVPGLGRFGDAADIAGLVAPRPLLVEAGDGDPLFPITGVRRAVARLRRIYAGSGASGSARLAVFSGVHRIDGARAFPFLADRLIAR